MSVLFRASGAGALMTDGKGSVLTEKQAGMLKALLAKHRECKITEKQTETMHSLIEKRDKPFELSATAKSFIKDIWLEEKWGYRIDVVTSELLKGLVCEQDGIELLSEVVPSSDFRVKNTERRSDKYFTGEPDVILPGEDTIEDIKCSWTIKTFMNADCNKLYYAQGQVYMHLFQRKKFRLHYCLVPTPKELIEAEERRLLWKYLGEEESPDFVESSERLWQSHKVLHIPKQKRVKTFAFGYNEEFMSELIKRAEIGRDYYNSLELPDNEFFKAIRKNS